MSKFTPADLLILIVLALLFCTVPVLAQQSSVSITPASIDTTIKAGSSYTQDFSLTNNTNERLRVRTSAADMWFDEKNVRTTTPAGTQPHSASVWIQFSPSEIIAEPHTSVIVKAIITVPRDATGSFYTVPVFEAMPVERPVMVTVANAFNAAATIGLRFRALIMLTTEIGAEYNVEIMGAKIVPPTPSSELELSLDLRNRGNAHAKVRGNYAIVDSAGKLVGRGSIEEKRFLPTQRNFINSKWSGDLKPGDYTAIVTLSYDRVGLEPTSLLQEIPFRVK